MQEPLTVTLFAVNGSEWKEIPTPGNGISEEEIGKSTKIAFRGIESPDCAIFFRGEMPVAGVSTLSRGGGYVILDVPEQSNYVDLDDVVILGK